MMGRINAKGAKRSRIRVKFTNMSYDVLGWSKCPYLHAAVQLLRDHNAEFSVLDKKTMVSFIASLNRRGTPLSATGEIWKTSPAIWRITTDVRGFEHRTFIGGHSDLKKVLDGIL